MFLPLQNSTPDGQGKRSRSSQEKEVIRRDQVADTLRKLKSNKFPQIFQGLRQATTLALTSQDAQDSGFRC